MSPGFVAYLAIGAVVAAAMVRDRSALRYASVGLLWPVVVVLIVLSALRAWLDDDNDRELPS